MEQVYAAIGHAFVWTLAVAGSVVVACLLFALGRDVVRGTVQVLRDFLRSFMG